MIWPVDSRVSQEYGSNPTAQLPEDSWLIRTFGNYQPNGHTGVDFPVVEGTPVRAVAAGVVKHVGWYTGSYTDNPYWISPSFAGFVLVIDHGGFIGIYAHLSGSPVAAGETVREGQTVAYSGNTGGSTGPHLHFEVLPDRWDFNNGMYGRVNPATFFGAAAIAPQSSTVTKESPLSAAEVKTITDAIKAEGAKTREYLKDLAFDGWSDNTGKKHPGFMWVIEENQKRIDAIKAAGGIK
jgi:murein DD-endopeptidase MepM/ murein hydrolase activator NlpD